MRGLQRDLVGDGRTDVAPVDAEAVHPDAFEHGEQQLCGPRRPTAPRRRRCTEPEAGHAGHDDVEVGERRDPVQRHAGQLGAVHGQDAPPARAQHRPLDQDDLLLLVEGVLVGDRRGGDHHHVGAHRVDRLDAAEAEEGVMGGVIFTAERDEPDVGIAGE